MARASSKRIAAANASTLVILFYGFLVTNTVHLLGRFWLFRSSATTRGALIYGLTEAIALGMWFTLRGMAKSGDDLAQSGLTAYMFDIIYVTWFIHISTALLSSYFWYLYLVIPAYASYVAYDKVILPYLFKGQSPFASLRSLAGGSAAAPQSGGHTTSSTADTLSKRQAKLQKRAEKGDPRVQARQR